MASDKRTLRRIEVNFAAVQGSYWMSICAFASFLAVYLGFRGFDDAQIGLASALSYTFTILLQLFFSNYSDAHVQVPIKRIVAGLLVLTILLATALHLLPMALGLVLLLYTLANALAHTVNGLLNAQIMQYVNVGIPVQYGWPRGFGSIVYASFALLLGSLMERHSPALLMPLFLICAALTIVAVLLMPEVYTLSNQRAALFVQEKGIAQSGYAAMLRRTPVLSLFLVAGTLLYVGQAGSMLFLVRVVEHAGGGKAQLGLAMFIQSGVEMPVMFMAPRILKRFEARSVLLFSLAFYVIKSFLLVFAGSMALVYFAMALSILCFGLYGIFSVYFVNSLVRPGEKVRAQGLVALCSSLGGILSSALSGLILQRWGLRPLLVLSTLILALAMFFMLLCYRMHKASSVDTPRAA